MNVIQQRSLNKLVAKSRGQIDWLTLLLLLLIGVAAGWFSVARYQAYNVTMYDLGNMAQPIWSVTQGQPLMVTSINGNISRLAVHVELIYFALAPLYALWPDPRTLLIVQSVIFALGALPAYRLGWRASHNRWIARTVMLIYLIYPGTQSAVLFDFHGDTLAMPLLLFALDALERRSWRSYAFWIVIALLCKVYVAIPVFVLGFLLLLTPATRRAGLWTIVGAVAYGGFAFFVIRSAFAPPETYASVGTSQGYLSFYFALQEGGLTYPKERLLYGFMLLLPILPVVWPAFLKLTPGLAVAIPVLLSTGPIAFDLRTHHFALLVPFVVWSFAGGAAALLQRKSRFYKFPLVASFSLLLTFLVSYILLDLRIKWEVLSMDPPSDWSLRSQRDHLRDHWLTDNVPQAVPLAASNYLAPHLLHREFIYTLAVYSEMGEPQAHYKKIVSQSDYAVTDALSDYSSIIHRHTALWSDYEAIALLLENSEFGLVNAQDGLLLFKRGASASERLSQQVDVLPTPSESNSTLQAQFGDLIGLQSAEITPLGGRRYQLRCDWVALQPLKDHPNFVAVSRLKGISHSRIPHLPTATLLPTSEWPIGQVIREEFEFEVSSDVPSGEYELLLGWYDTTSPEAWRTDEESRLGEEVRLMTITVP
jgi:uncharacterized membrane protein